MSLIITSRQGQVVTLTLNRPERRNALGVEMLQAFSSAISATESDPSARVLVIRGAGPAFCAGLDLVEASDASGAEASAALIARVLQLLSGSRLATIAVVHGAAIAGGAGLMSACDFVLAAEDTRIGYPEVRRGLVAGLVMTFLRRQVRERDVREMLLTGEIFSAARAKDVGLVNRVVPAAELDATVAQFIAQILAGGPAAIAHTKELLGQLWPRAVEADLKHALAFHLKARNSAEALEGIAAFREKRAPKWPE
ncbi:MAG: hypothetical protein JWM35_2503 [Verrucomicrobia bacterium]|nr:hypothetical protein [Verrucomicrobiota bacterium]